MKLSSLPLTLSLKSQLARSRIVGLAFLALVSTFLHAAQSTQPLQVQGVVEEINDVLRTPFARTMGFQSYGQSVRMPIDVPAGKRFVVETISFSLSVKHNGYVVVSVEPLIGGLRAPIYLSAQSTTAMNQSGNSLFGVRTGTHAVNLRVDGKTALNNELELVVNRQVGDTSELLLSATVAGYLVDIPVS